MLKQFLITLLLFGLHFFYIFSNIVEEDYINPFLWLLPGEMGVPSWCHIWK